MKHLLILFLVVGMLGGCATTETDSDSEATSDVDEAISTSENDPSEAQTTNETSEQDLMSEPAPEAPDQMATEAPPPPPIVENTPEPAPEIPPPVEEPPALEAAQPPAPMESLGEKARVIAIDYKANENGGTIEVKTNVPVQYTTRTNAQSNQFIVELQNTVVAKQFQRPYDTKEFGGAIASVNAYQAQGTPNTTRIVVQMREAISPGVSQDGNKISIAAAGGTSMQSFAASEPPAAGTAEESIPEADESAPQEAVSESEIGNYTYADFLAGKVKFYGRPISIEVKDTDIREVFRFIAEESGVNILVGDDVGGKVTMKLRQVPWDQALSVILQSKQLGYSKQGNILRIAPLRSLQQESEAARLVLESQKQVQPLRVQLFPISYAKAEDLEVQVRDFISSRGKVKADKRTNILVVTDVEDEIKRIKTLIEKLDTQTPQVLIEAKVVEAREGYSKIVGVNWNMQGQTNDVSSILGGNSTLTPNLAVNSPQSGNLALDVNIGGLDVFGDINASLRLLEKESLVKVISAPRVVTLDRTDAHIEQTTQFPVFGTTLSASGAAQPTVAFQDVKLELNVKPQITNDGGIIMEVRILREFPDALEANRTGTSSARPVNRRQANTSVLVENGDTVVIGGIYQSDVTEGETGVPWLRKIPIIGALFRQRTTTRDKNELVIFLTPRVLNREKAFIKNTDEGGA